MNGTSIGAGLSSIAVLARDSFSHRAHLHHPPKAQTIFQRSARHITPRPVRRQVIVLARSPTSEEMVNKILFWSGFGLAVRFWQLGIEMRPFFQRENWIIYPIYGGLGASFGYWLTGVEDNQMRYLSETRQRLIEKRRRRAEREGGLDSGSKAQKEDESLIA